MKCASISKEQAVRNSSDFSLSGGAKKVVAIPAKVCMSNITKTIKLIQDRYQAVEDLKQLVFNPDLHANEVNQLQKMIEKHYWLFGKQYNLVTVAEPNFQETLKRYLKIFTQRI